MFGWGALELARIPFAFTIAFHIIFPAPQNRPNATILFWIFRVTVGLGLLMIAVGLRYMLRLIRKGPAQLFFIKNIETALRLVVAAAVSVYMPTEVC